MDVFFIIDILISFNTGYYKGGMIVMKRRIITNKYLKGWFIIDFIASFPYYFIFLLSTSYDPNEFTGLIFKAPEFVRLLKIAKFLLIIKLLRVAKLSRMLYKIEEYIIVDSLNAILYFIKLILLILIIAHWLACFIWSLGLDEMNLLG